MTWFLLLLTAGAAPVTAALADDQAAPLAPDPKPWSTSLAPAPGPARAFGGHAAGCLQGARALPGIGRGYQVTRPARRRHYGHPALIRYLRALGTRIAQAKIGPMMIGDLAQPRGGPAPTGHSSHQTGLDVDIWYETPPEARRRPLGEAERNQLRATAVVDLRSRTLTARWQPEMLRVLALAARPPEVDRIFVHPRIKQVLCAQAKGARGWLAKIRPWWGHHDHFHVRLRCPADSPDCAAQPPLGDDLGCEALDWWFSEDSLKTLEQRQQRKAEGKPPLPAACRALIQPVTAAQPPS